MDAYSWSKGKEGSDYQLSLDIGLLLWQGEGVWIRRDTVGGLFDSENSWREC